MDALQAYQSSDSEDEDTHLKRTLSDGAPKCQNLTSSSTLGSILPRPDLNFSTSSLKHERMTGKEMVIHPVLPWSKPFERRETVTRRLVSQTQGVSFGENGQSVSVRLDPLHTNRTSDNNRVFHNGKLLQKTNKPHPYLHSQQLGPLNPYDPEHRAAPSYSSLLTSSHQSTSSAVSTESASQTSRSFYPLTSDAKMSSKRPAVHVTQPYIPKRLRQSHQESVAGEGSCSSSLSSQGKSREKLYTTSSFIAHQIDRKFTSKLPKRRTIQCCLHTGPVTHVRWCAPQFSHLLLSSSMDKTIRIWNGIGQDGCCLQTLKCHGGAIKDAQWGRGGYTVVSCGYDKTARLCDVESGKELQVFDHSSYATCIKTKPDDPDVFITGTSNSSIYCWDIRTGNQEHEYKGKLGQILDVEFLPGSVEFASSCDVVSRDSADKTIMVWDLRSTAVVSNQLYHEKYTCPCLRRHPTKSVFAAQSNANYVALFSAIRPYKLNKYNRYEGHRLEGYHIGCDFSPDGALLASGSSDGMAYIYDFQSTGKLKTLQCHSGPCTDVAWHPVLPGVMATGGWDGRICVWH
ncbi:WD repeat-containing protein 25-like [Asterias amurensis]|uniref:WD repeat-containing protein 25-like n=1 Tax=Asterias amurensis TaxID=7602 RepID=UPI003AB8AF2F